MEVGHRGARRRRDLAAAAVVALQGDLGVGTPAGPFERDQASSLAGRRRFLLRMARLHEGASRLAGGRLDRELGVDDRPRVGDDERADDEDEQAKGERLESTHLSSLVATTSPQARHRSRSTRTRTVRSTRLPRAAPNAGGNSVILRAWTVTTTSSAVVPVQSKVTRPSRAKAPRLSIARSVAVAWPADAVGSSARARRLAAS